MPAARRVPHCSIHRPVDASIDRPLSMLSDWRSPSARAGRREETPQCRNETSTTSRAQVGSVVRCLPTRKVGAIFGCAEPRRFGQSS